MALEKAVKEFVQAVWDKGQKDNWPVNVGDIKQFGDDPVSARSSLRRVLTECDKRNYFKATLEGDIHSISKSAKALIGVQDS